MTRPLTLRRLLPLLLRVTSYFKPPKGTLVSEAPESNSALAPESAPIATAPAGDLPTAEIHPAVAQLAAAVNATPAVPPQSAANVVAGILNQTLPVVLQASRASPRTTVYVSLGVGVLEALIGLLYPHPAA